MSSKTFLIILTLAAVLGFAFFANAQINDTDALIEQIQAQIQDLLSQVAELLPQESGEASSNVQQGYYFSQNLGFANSGSEDVGKLHEILDMEGISYAPDTGNTYGEGTARAVKEYQEKYASEILVPLGLSEGTGYVGDSTRAKLNRATPVPVTPDDSCTGGETKCEGQSVMICREPVLWFRTVKGWYKLEDCTYGCENGACKPPPPQCTVGETKCDRQSLMVCIESISGAISWVKSETCTYGCENGACKPKPPVPDDECKSGDVRCCTVDWGTRVGASGLQYCGGRCAFVGGCYRAWGSCVPCPNPSETCVTPDVGWPHCEYVASSGGGGGGGGGEPYDQLCPGESCVQGESRCNGNAIQLCRPHPLAGCKASGAQEWIWTDSMPCGNNGQCIQTSSGSAYCEAEEGEIGPGREIGPGPGPESVRGSSCCATSQGFSGTRSYAIDNAGIIFLSECVPCLLGNECNEYIDDENISGRQVEAVCGPPEAPGDGWCHNFNQNFGLGSTWHSELDYLHVALGKQGIAYTPDYYGSVGQKVFGQRTWEAVVRFQEKYASEILAPLGFSQGTGYVGYRTRLKLNQIYGCDVQSPISCTQEVKECPDGSYVGRVPPNCGFAECPSGAISACTPSWECSSWNVCSNGTQARTCVDQRGCGDNSSKPNETQGCTSFCSPDWKCGNWSACTNGQQTRTCIDANGCGVTTNKPATTQSCVSTCTPSWTCSDWALCSNGIQTRTCVDQNGCGVTTNKPATTQSCISTCTPNWTCGDWSACVNGSQTRTCVDQNGCGVTTNKPATTQSCTSTCTPNWTCGDWSACVNGTQTRTCIDQNGCGDNSNKPIEAQGCVSFCTPNWTCSDWGLCVNGSQTRTCVDANACGVTSGKPSETQSCVVTCSDSDGGLDLNVKGVATDSNGYSAADSCLAPGINNWISEVYCQDGEIRSVQLYCDYSCEDGACKIAPSPGIISPNGGEVWEVGKTYNILWSGITVSIDIFVNNTRVATGISGSAGSYSWTIPTSIPPGGYRIKLKRNAYPYDVLAQSDNYFSIIGGNCADAVTTPYCCSDSDNGYNYYVKGVAAEYRYGKFQYSIADECSGNAVVEAWCALDGRLEQTAVYCENGCEDGACK